MTIYSNGIYVFLIGKDYFIDKYLGALSTTQKWTGHRATASNLVKVFRQAQAFYKARICTH